MGVKYDYKNEIKSKEKHESTVKGNPCLEENNKFESFYSWLDEFIFHICLALAVFGETEQIGILKTIDIDRLIHVWIIKRLMV